MGTFVAVIRGTEEERAAWPEGFLGQLRDWGIELDPFGTKRWMVSTYGHGGLAGAEFLDPEEGWARYADAAWAAQRSPCPFLDDYSIIGFVEWDPWDDKPEARKEWLIALLKEGKGVIADPSTGRYRNAVIEVQASATGLLGKWGFDDGDSALSRDAEWKGYRGAVCREMEKTLAAHGLYTDIGGPLYTCHNLFRSNGGFFLDANRAIPVAEGEIYGRLCGITFQFWGYDFTIGDDPMFGGDQHELEVSETNHAPPSAELGRSASGPAHHADD